MAKVGDSAHTQHGLGKITEIINERGRLSYRVAGRGFAVWVDQTKLRVAADENLFSFGPMNDFQEKAQHTPQYGQGDPEMAYMAGLDATIDPGGSQSVNEKNHTTLPWDGTPQYSVDMFRQDQNIQPGENEIDPDKRLHPSDSLSGAGRSQPRGPQPNPQLFAGGGGDNPFADERTASLHRYADDGWSHQHDPNEASNFPDMGGQENALSRGVQKAMGPYMKGLLWADDHLPGSEAWEQKHPTPRHKASFERPAGLDDRYAFFQVEADGDSPVAQFQRDPAGFIRTCGYLWTDGDDSLEKYADYTALLDADTAPLEKQAAWKDVRQKAMRLRHEGKVAVNDIAENRIYATVEGDHGTYDVMLAKSGALGNSQSVADWACSCEWGRWAFKRQMTYIGRLCSHAYAAYLDMQSQYMKDNPQHFQKAAAVSVSDFKSWLKENDQGPEVSSVHNYLHTTGQEATQDDVEKLYDYVSHNYDETPERNYDVGYGNDPEEAYKTADLLRTRPLSMSPSLRAVPEKGENEWTDVTSDDRKTTGPDDIQKAALLYLHGASEGITDFAGGVGGSADAGMGAMPAAAAPSDGAAGATGDTGGMLDSMPSAGGVDTGVGGGGSDVGAMQDMGPNIMSSLHYAEGDEALLNKLRELSTEDASDNEGHMDEHNDKLRDLTDELNDRGYDASYMVASYRAAAEDKTPADGNGDFLGQSSPGFPDQGYAGSGPDPKDWISDSAGYVDENERPDFEDVTDLDGDIIKFNDSRSKPPQGPRHASLDELTASLHYAEDDDMYEGAGGAGDSEVYHPGQEQPQDNLGGQAPQQSNSMFGGGVAPGMFGDEGNLRSAAGEDMGYFNPNNAGADDWQAGSGEDFANAVGDAVDQAVPDNPLDSGGGAAEDGAAGEGAAAAGEGGAAAGGLGELAPLLAVAANDAPFDVAAFDRGEFVAPGGGEARRAGRLGSGPKSKVRVDPGSRDGTVPGQRPVQHQANIPEDFGFDGGQEIEAYLQDGGDPSGADIVAAFQRSGAAEGVMGNSAPAQGTMDDFSSSPMVQAMLRTAGRTFSPEEQRMLEAEAHPQGARNLPTPDELAGTHYALGM